MPFTVFDVALYALLSKHTKYTCKAKRSISPALVVVVEVAIVVAVVSGHILICQILGVGPLTCLPYVRDVARAASVRKIVIFG